MNALQVLHLGDHVAQVLGMAPLLATAGHRTIVGPGQRRFVERGGNTRLPLFPNSVQVGAVELGLEYVIDLVRGK